MHIGLTRGAYLVGLDFNPSDNPHVQKIKVLAAQLINAINDIEVVFDDTWSQRDKQIARCKAIAITNIEQGTMWALKAATKPEPPD